MLSEHLSSMALSCWEPKRREEEVAVAEKQQYICRLRNSLTTFRLEKCFCMLMGERRDADR